MLPGGTNTGVYLNGEVAILIDPGISKSRGNGISKLMIENNHLITNIFLTHEHADHYGAAGSIKENFPSLNISASKECKKNLDDPNSFIRYINGGNHNTLLLSYFDEINQNIKVDCCFDEIKKNSSIELFNFVNLPGHSDGSTGIITPDKILFLGDSLIPESILKKYPIPLITNLSNYYDSIEIIKNLDFEKSVLGHERKILSKDETICLCEFNKSNAQSTEFLIEDILSKKSSLDHLISKILREYKFELNYKEFLFFKSTILSMVSHIIDKKKIIVKIENGTLLYEKS